MSGDHNMNQKPLVKTYCSGKQNYAKPREWVDLTDEEVMQALGGNAPDLVLYARTIEAKLKEKNT